MILNRFFAVYVPGTIQGNVPAPELQAMMVDVALNRMVDAFGGATIIKTIGGYRLATGELVKEPIVIVKSYCDDREFFDRKPIVDQLAVEICHEMSQETVGVESHIGLELINASSLLKIAA